MEENKIENDENAIGSYPEEENGGSYLNPSVTDIAEVSGLGAESEDVSYRANSDEVLESEREEYNRLIKTRFKELYSEDTQRLINRRFRKYRVMEEKCRVMEESLRAMEINVAESEKRLSEMSARLADESARVARETEERVIAEIRAKRLRPSENAVYPRHSSVHPDVSKLTKNERARIAKRAADGEKIHF